jgi:hypothetical protein
VGFPRQFYVPKIERRISTYTDRIVALKNLAVTPNHLCFSAVGMAAPTTRRTEFKFWGRTPPYLNFGSIIFQLNREMWLMARGLTDVLKWLNFTALMQYPNMRRLTMVCLLAAILNIPLWSYAINILSEPVFTQAPNAPLAGTLQLNTDVASRVSVLVSYGTNTWERNFYDFATAHSIPLYGFKPGQTNLIQVTAYDQYRNAYTATQTLTFVTAPLPANFPHATVLKSEPSQMEPGDTLCVINNRTTGSAYITIMDNAGQVLWYHPVLQSGDIDVDQLNDGNLFIHESPPANRFVELNLLGETVQTWNAAAGYPVNSHVGILTDHGTILYLSDVSETVPNFPNVTLPVNSGTDTNVSLKTVQVDDNPVVEISATNGELLHVWSALNLLDPTRLTYLTGQYPSSYGIDSEHANAIVDDTNDDSIIVSQRDENTVYKFSRTTGQLIWILAPHANWPANLQQYLLTPVSTPFEWSYGQHAPALTPQGTLLVFDDGIDRASPFDPPIPDVDNYSRAVEYSIDETNMTISQVWDSYDSGLGDGDRMMSEIMGNTDWLPQTGHVLVTYAWVNYTNGVLVASNGALMARIVEYTHDPVPQVVFDLAFWDYDNTNSHYLGYYCYRSHRIPDLYAHPVEPVTDIILDDKNQTPRLEFSADPTHSYSIQATTDLINWTTIGYALQDGNAGDFYFDDLDAGESSDRFYRVITQ